MEHIFKYDFFFALPDQEARKGYDGAVHDLAKKVAVRQYNGRLLIFKKGEDPNEMSNNTRCNALKKKIVSY